MRTAAQRLVRWLAAGLVGLLAVTAAGSPTVWQASAAPPAPSVRAASAVLVGVGSRRVLWEKDGRVRRAPASTTKIMTALAVVERGGLDEMVTVSPRAAATSGSTVWLSAGETLSVQDLLYGLLLTSGNDAAVALAEHVAGSVDDFARLMNEEARAIGATDTHFRNPHGLDEPGHYTTARDLALIAARALQEPLVARIVATKRATIAWPGHEVDRALRNKNRLLWEYEGADGVKTGFTDEAGKCLVASATRGGLHLVAVVMGSPDIWGAAAAILNYGFAKLSAATVARRGDVVRSIRVVGGDRERLPLVARDDLVVAVSPGEGERIRTRLDGLDELRAPVRAGVTYGRLVAVLDGEDVASVPLVAAQDAKAQTVFRSFWGKLFDLFRTMIRNIAGRAMGRPR
ncbi:MAG: D-alanyl-D-alanine carboxypeptidase family protein [Bacillota bacterium]